MDVFRGLTHPIKATEHILWWNLFDPGDDVVL